MDWANERYVRLYTRDTPEWLCMDWQGRALWPLLIRKVDRSGVLATRLGSRGVAALVGLPVEVVDVGMTALLADGCLRDHQLGFVIPNFIEAQETPQSDTQRKRDSRERRRVVTNRDIGSQNVTESHTESHGVTRSHTESHAVTPIRSEPSPDQTSPDQKDLPLPRKRSSGPRDPKPPVPGHQETIACFTEAFERAYRTKPTWGGRRGRQVQELLSAHGEAEVRRRIGILFGGGLAWPAGPYDFDTLVKHFDKLAQPAAARAGPGNGNRTGPTLLQSLLTDIEILERDELEKARQCE
jgi:hypothetical protein